MSSSTAGVVCAVGLNDIVLDKGSGGPSVKRDQTVTTSIDGSSVLDGAGHKSVEVNVFMSFLPHRAAPVCQPIPATTSVLALVHFRE